MGPCRGPGPERGAELGAHLQGGDGLRICFHTKSCRWNQGVRQATGQMRLEGSCTSITTEGGESQEAASHQQLNISLAQRVSAATSIRWGNKILSTHRVVFFFSELKYIQFLTSSQKTRKIPTLSNPSGNCSVFLVFLRILLSLLQGPQGSHSTQPLTLVPT